MTMAAWLKAAENGALGEARARAFQMERFWVLEICVDIQGADYLVQRKLTSQNFMNSDPPRLGVVQVKFIQDGGTSISINKEYLCDSDDNPYNEFFLLVFTGREDEESGYLLSSADVLREFSERAKDDRILLVISGAHLMATSNYEIVQRKHALDRIEHALANADFVSNRRFLSDSYYIKISPDQIDQDLTAPLDNSYCNLRDMFFEEKKKVQSVLFDIEEIAETMRKMLSATDPEVAIELYDEKITQFVGGGQQNIYFSADFFNDEDFLSAIRNHRARLSRLQELGVVGSYFEILETFERTVIERLTNTDFASTTETIRITVTYDSDTMRNVRVDIIASDTDNPTPHVELSRKGKQIVFYDVRNPKLKHAANKATAVVEREEIVRSMVWKFRRPFQAALDALYIGDDLLAF